MNETKFLKNELDYVEGVSTIKNFLKTFAKSVIKQNWIPFDKNETDRAWAFDKKREIKLPKEFKPTNIKIYKATLGSNNQYIKGNLITEDNYILLKNVIKGIKDDTSNGTQINDRVLIEVTYENKIFQQVTFIENTIESGQDLPFCTLKSRPQGDIELYEEEVVKITKEPLYQEGGNQFYKFGKCPISQAKDGTNKLMIYRNDSLVPESEYTVDYYNGILLFKNIQTEHADNITATYGHKTGKRKGSPIEKTKYKRHQDILIDITSSQELKDKDYVIDVDYYWQLHYPSKVQNIKDKIILKTNVDLSKNGDRFKLKTYYVEMKYMDFDRGNESEDYRTGIQVRFGSKLKELGAGYTVDKKKAKAETNILSEETEIMPKLEEEVPTLDDNFSCEWAKWSWYKKSAFDDGVVFQDWLPIRFAINFTKEYMNVFIQGNQAPDIGEFESHYLMGYAYFGMLKNYDNMKVEDLENNFAMTVSSGEPPVLTHKRWGERTGNSITDITMERTNSNIPYQGHNVSFYTSPEFMEKHFINYSDFTGSFHFSEITVLHTTERERGMMQGVLVGDQSALSNFDELILNKDEFDLKGVLTQDGEILNKCGFPFKSKETKWVHLAVNSPYSFLNNSPNTVYGLAIRKE